MDWAGLAGNALSFFDSVHYSAQEQAADKLQADGIRAASEAAAAQAKAAETAARYGALAAESQASSQLRMVMIGAGALVAVGALFVLAR